MSHIRLAPPLAYPCTECTSMHTFTRPTHFTLSCRLARLVKYSFYKNVAFAFALFYFQFYNGFSGQALVDGISAAAYNVVFTSLPILLFAVLDRPVRHFSTLMRYPQVGGPRLHGSLPQPSPCCSVLDASASDLPGLFKGNKAAWLPQAAVQLPHSVLRNVVVPSWNMPDACRLCLLDAACVLSTAASCTAHVPACTHSFLFETPGAQGLRSWLRRCTTSRAA